MAGSKAAPVCHGVVCVSVEHDDGKGQQVCAIGCTMVHGQSNASLTNVGWKGVRQSLMNFSKPSRSTKDGACTSNALLLHQGVYQKGTLCTICQVAWRGTHLF